MYRNVYPREARKKAFFGRFQSKICRNFPQIGFSLVNSGESGCPPMANWGASKLSQSFDLSPYLTKEFTRMMSVKLVLAFAEKYENSDHLVLFLPPPNSVVVWECTILCRGWNNWYAIALLLSSVAFFCFNLSRDLECSFCVLQERPQNNSRAKHERTKNWTGEWRFFSILKYSHGKRENLHTPAQPRLLHHHQTAKFQKTTPSTLHEISRILRVKKTSLENPESRR